MYIIRIIQPWYTCWIYPFVAPIRGFSNQRHANHPKLVLPTPSQSRRIYDMNQNNQRESEEQTIQRGSAMCLHPRGRREKILIRTIELQELQID